MRINQHYTPYFCGTPAALAEFIAEEPLRAQPLYLPDEPGSLNQNKPFGSDLVTGQGPRHLGDATPLQNPPIYDAWAVIQMNNLMVGLDVWKSIQMGNLMIGCLQQDLF